MCFRTDPRGLRPVPRGSAGLLLKIISGKLCRTSGERPANVRRSTAESAQIRADPPGLRRELAELFAEKMSARNVRGGRTSAVNTLPPRTMVLGKIFMATIFFSEQLRQFAAGPRGSVRIRADSAVLRRTFAGRWAEFAGNYFWRKAGGSAQNRAESARIHTFPRGSAAEGLPPREYPKIRLTCRLIKFNLPSTYPIVNTFYLQLCVCLQFTLSLQFTYN